MKLGFVAYFNEETANFAGKAGFECLECFADRGTALDLDMLTSAGFDSIIKINEHRYDKRGYRPVSPSTAIRLRL